MNTQYVIKTKTNKYIGLDTPSGGYPYELDTVTHARIWNNKHDAKLYRDTFKNEDWTLHEVKINTKPITWI